MRLGRLHPILIATFVAVLGATDSFAACSISWTNPSGGNWTTASNWSTGTVPITTSEVCITAGGTYTVTLSTATTVANVTLGGASGSQRLILTEALTLSSNMSSVGANGTLELSGTTIDGAGDLTVLGQLEITGFGTIGGSGIATIASGAALNINTYNPVWIDRTLNNDGTTTFNAQRALSGTGTFNNRAGATFLIPADMYCCGITIAFNNAGTFQKSGGTGVLPISGVFENSGVLSIQSGSVSFEGSGQFIARGELNAAVGTTVRFQNSGTTFHSTATFAGGGTFISSAPITLVGTVVWPAGQTFQLQSDVSGDDFRIEGVVDWNGSSVISGPGSLTIATGGVLNLQAGNPMTLNRLLDNEGLTTFTAIRRLIGTGPFNNNSTGVFDIQVDANVFTGTLIGVPFTNAGLFKKSGGTSSFPVTSSFTNLGQIFAQSGTIAFTESGVVVSSGEIGAASNARVLIQNAGVTLQSTATFSGTGNVDFQAPVAIVGTVVLTPGPRYQLASNISGDDLRIAGTADWSASSTISGPGTLTVDLTGVLNLTASNPMTLSRQLDNEGTTNFSAIRSLNGTATFFNRSTGVFDLQVDQTAGAGTTISVPIMNSGTFKKSGGAGSFPINGGFTNTGQLLAQSGTLVFSDFTQTDGQTILAGGNISSSSTVNINGGLLTGAGTVTGNVSNGGSVAPGGSAGTLTISGSYTQTSAGELSIEIGGLTEGTQFDKLAVTGPSTLAGVVNVSVINSFSPNVSDSFRVMTFGSRSGSFSTFNGLAIGGGKALQANLGATDLTFLTVTNALTITSVTPNSGLTSGGTSVTIVGTNFQPGASLTFGGTTASNISVVNSTTMTATTPALPAGSVNVVITNPDEQSASLTNGFTYVATSPTISSISPSSGPATGGTSVTVSGTNFQPGASLTFGGTTVSNITVVNSTTMTATTPAFPAGSVNVVITNPDEQSASLTNGFTYVATSPTISSISPPSGPATGGTSVTVSGTNFQSGASLTFGGTAVVNVVVVSPTTITGVTPAHLAGFADVTVTNPDNGSFTAADGFEYKEGASVVVNSNPPPIFAEAGSTGSATSFVVSNTGGSATSLSLFRSANFFTVSPAALALAPGESGTIAINPSQQPVGAYSGLVELAGDGVPPGLSVPVALIVYGPPGVDVPDVVPVRVRVDVWGSGTTLPGSIEFHNEGAASATGIVVSEASWLIPDPTPVTIPAGGTSSIPFTINRDYRPDPRSTDSLLTVVRFVYPSAPSGAKTAAASPPGSTPGSHVSDTPSLAVQTGTLPPLTTRQLGLVLPGVRSFDQPGRRLLTDVVMSVSALDNSLGVFFLAAGAPSSGVLRGTNLSSISPASPILLADVVGKGFDRPEAKGSLHLRTSSTSGLTIDSTLNVISDVRQLLVYRESPVTRSDRGAGPGEALYLPGVAALVDAGATLFVQEVAGGSTRFTIGSLDASGALLHSGGPFEIDSFQLHEEAWVPLQNAATLVVRNVGSAGRLSVVCEENTDRLDALSLWDATSIHGGSRSERLVIPWAASDGTGEPEVPVRRRPVRPGSGKAARTESDGRAATRLAIHSPTGAEVSLLLRTTRRTAEASVALAPGETRLFADAFGELFGSTGPESGTVFLEPTTGEIGITAWYVSEHGEEPTVAGLPIVPASSAMTAGASKSFRNVHDASRASIDSRVAAASTPALVLVETAGAPANVRVTVGVTRPGLAALTKSVNVSLGPGDARVLDDLVRQVLGSAREREGDLFDVDVTIAVVGGTGRVLPALVTRVVRSGDHTVRVR